VPNRPKMEAYITELDFFVKVYRLKQLHIGVRIILVIQRLRSFMFTQFMAAEVMRLLFLEMAAISQQYFTQITGSVVGINRPSKPLLVQHRYIARVIQVGVGQKHCVQ